MGEVNIRTVSNRELREVVREHGLLFRTRDGIHWIINDKGHELIGVNEKLNTYYVDQINGLDIPHEIIDAIKLYIETPDSIRNAPVRYWLRLREEYCLIFQIDEHENYVSLDEEGEIRIDAFGSGKNDGTDKMQFTVIEIAKLPNQEVIEMCDKVEVF